MNNNTKQHNVLHVKYKGVNYVQSYATLFEKKSSLIAL